MCTKTFPTAHVDAAPAYPLKDGDRWFVVNLDGSRAYFTDYARAFTYAGAVFQAYAAARPLPVNRRILRSIVDDLRRVNHRIPSREVGRVLAVLTVLLGREVPA